MILYYEIRNKIKEAIKKTYKTYFKCDVNITKSGEVYVTSLYTGKQCNTDDLTLFTSGGWFPIDLEFGSTDYCKDCVYDERGYVIEWCKICKDFHVEDFMVNMEESGELDRLVNEAMNFVMEV